MATTYITTRRLIRALRMERGWTQEQLAERAGLDYKYYQLFETEHTGAPSLRMVESLAGVLGVRPWVLLCDDPALIKKHTALSPALLTADRKIGRPRKVQKTENGQHKMAAYEKMPPSCVVGMKH